ncbi:MAG: hypothetical protein ACYC96_14970 [Fimbriimonadaceae bacterium]
MKPTRRLTLKESKREHPIRIVSPTDFVYEVGEAIDPLEVLRDPSFSLYCIDRENNAAIFVECHDYEALYQAPFYYQAQSQFAVGLVSMPLQVFHRLAREIALPANGLVFIHSVGRCGSTLVSKVLAALPCVHSLSEPDDLTQMIGFRDADGSSDQWLRDLIVSSTKWRCKPRPGAPPDWVAIKMRSEVLALADLLGPQFEHSKHFFLYRNAVSWMGSLFRGYQPDRDVYDPVLNRKMEESWGNTLTLVREYRSPEAPMNPIQIRVLAWITCMEAYLKLAEMGIPLCAARYEDLTEHPVPILQGLFRFCGIDAFDWDVIGDVLGRDSQAGSIYDREARRKQTRELTAELVADIHALIATRPMLLTANVRMPLTLSADPT